MNTAAPGSVVWLNGRLLPAAEARLSPLDRGFLLGEGTFETLRAYDGRPFAIARHWERLRASCDVLGLETPAQDVFRTALEEVLAACGMTNARLRFTCTKGDGSAATTLATAAALPVRNRTSSVVLVPWPRNERSPLTAAKSISYGENLVALAHAQQRGADEGVFLNTRGELCEGTGSNMFVVRNGVLMTPPLSSGCLPGVTRALVLELARNEGIPATETVLQPEALSSSDEAFLTSSTREVQPIALVDGKTISAPTGGVCARLAQLFHQITDRNPAP